MQLVFAVITIGPWAFLIFYDIFLYVWRSIWYEMPIVGGRAQGKRRPRAPSLKERPNGKPRRFSMVRPATLNEHVAQARDTNEERDEDLENDD